AIWRAAGREVAVAGNVGTAVSSLDGLGDAATVVCEASSFQLEDTIAFAPEVAVLLNITPDHLDRHGTFEDYRDAKRAIFAHQDAADLAVLPLAQTELRSGAAHTITFGGEGADLALRDGVLEWQGRELLPAEQIALPGEHNVENAM